MALITARIFLFSGASQASEFWSIAPEPELKTLWVTNLTSQNQVLNLGTHPISVAAYARLEIPLNEFKNEVWLPAKSQQNKIFSLRISTKHEDQFSLIAGQSTRWKVRVSRQSDLVLFNSAPFEQNLKLQASPENILQVHLKAGEKRRLSLPTSMETSLLTISGEARFSGILISPWGSRALIPDPIPVLFPEVLASPSTIRYFRVSTSSRQESYVLPLSDPAQIQQAQNQLAHPISLSHTTESSEFFPRIIVARVAFGSGNHNRDLSSKAKVPWSWHVEKFLRFAELASQECNGSPGQIEEQLKSVIDSSGIICFWNDRIIEELSRETVAGY